MIDEEEIRRLKNDIHKQLEKSEDRKIRIDLIDASTNLQKALYKFSRKDKPDECEDSGCGRSPSIYFDHKSMWLCANHYNELKAHLR